MKPEILICNDDGITSPFLETFTKAFCEVANVTVVVPHTEQSWIGRAYSRHRELTLTDMGKIDSAKIFTVDGTPSDCVNIAVNHLFGDSELSAVVSGLNIGQNIALPLLWSSGTFSAAAEGAAAGIQSYAFSQQLLKEHYEICRLRHEKNPEDLQRCVLAASRHAAEFVMGTLYQSSHKAGDVYNVNYPVNFSAETPFVRCKPAKLKIAGLYKRGEDGKFHFQYAVGDPQEDTSQTDIEALQQGKGSYSVINIWTARDM